jgi:putative flippase GtrA
LTLIAGVFGDEMDGVRMLDRGELRRFVVVGIVNTAFGYTTFVLLIWLGVSAPVSLLLATIAGVLFNFVTTGHFVFNSVGWRPLGRFIAAYGTVYVTNLAILDTLRAKGIGAIAAQGLALLLVVPLSFVILKWFVFKGHASVHD